MLTPDTTDSVRRWRAQREAGRSSRGPAAAPEAPQEFHPHSEQAAEEERQRQLRR